MKMEFGNGCIKPRKLRTHIMLQFSVVMFDGYCSALSNIINTTVSSE